MTPSPEEASGPEAFEFPVYARLGLEVVEGDGCRIFTREGQELIDFYGGHAVAALGYRHPQAARGAEPAG